MPSERPETPFSRRFRQFLRTYRFPFSILILAIGILLTVLAAGDLTPLNSVAPFPSINSATDTSGANYNLVFVFLGPIVSIIGGYLVGAYYLARRKFEHLMVTKSKAEFLRNIPELEDLLWELTPGDEVRYDRKKVDLKIRR